MLPDSDGEAACGVGILRDGIARIPKVVSEEQWINPASLFMQWESHLVVLWEHAASIFAVHVSVV
jgi:hypothetical protein